jgi:nitroimidazol reductase NimA-like FMN-containing flavoprotein (pyridoxamine 5'-phosphate oxidase superfamily)
MTDKHAPNLDRAGMERILAEEEAGVLCLADGDQPYGVPLSYAWIDGRIVFHCAAEGRKLDVLRRNDRAAFVVFRSPDRTAPHAEGECSVRFESVLVFGRARVIDDPAERLDLLRRFKAHFDRRLERAGDADPVTAKAAAKTGCVAIAVDAMTGRRKDRPGDPGPDG